MTTSWIHRSFAPVKQTFPAWLTNPLRSTATAFLTPAMFSYKSGHFRSSFKMAAVTKEGDPIPWYTYPSIEFLKHRNFADKMVLEFGGGQSTRWWAKRAKRVVTLEGDEAWYDTIKDSMAPNVELHHVSMASAAANREAVEAILAAKPYEAYDVIVIDGLHREEMIPIAQRLIAPDGVIICDNAEGYSFYEGFASSEMNRVDFYGYAPGGIAPSTTSIYFNIGSFVFSPSYPIHRPTGEI